MEEVRQFLERKYGPEAVREKGLRVYTTPRHQAAEVAEDTLRKGLRDDDKRRAWRGPEKNILKNPQSSRTASPSAWKPTLDDDWKKPFCGG